VSDRARLRDPKQNPPAVYDGGLGLGRSHKKSRPGKPVTLHRRLDTRSPAGDRRPGTTATAGAGVGQAGTGRSDRIGLRSGSLLVGMVVPKAWTETALTPCFASDRTVRALETGSMWNAERRLRAHPSE
jgi:hypothetical protein